MADRQSGEGAALRLAQADGGGGAAGAGAAPAAGPDCAITAEGRPITIPVLANDSGPGGEAPTLLSTSGITAGEATLNADGTITFRSDEPGLQSFRYQVGDGRGGSSSGEVDVLVNPTVGALAEPVLTGVDNAQLSRTARACTDATALGVTTLEGTEVTVPPPAAGERILVATEPGQRIVLDDPAFARATYLSVDGGLLVLTQDGHVVFLSDFVASTGSGDPVTLAVAGREPVSGEALLARLQPLTAPAAGEPVVGRVEPEVGPEHGGGADFSPYDPGALPPGLLALGPLGPTSLAFGSEFLIEGTGDETLAGGLPSAPPPLGNEPPTISGAADVARQAGTLTITPEFSSAGPLPGLVEATPVPPEQINGVDPANLRIGPSGDASIIFNDEVATFQDTLGVYLIGENGEIVDPKIVFPQIEHADALPGGGSKRPGGGPLNPGDQMALSELYDASQLQPGTQFGLFIVANGFRLNGGGFDGDLRFVSGTDAATIFDAAPDLVLTRGDGSTSVLRGDIYHTADATPGTPLDNPLNDGGNGQALSGLMPDRSGLTIAFEDKPLGVEDDDFNDVLIDVELTPSLQVAFAGGDFEVFTNTVVNDQDDPNLSRAVVELVGGVQPGDALLLGAALEGTGVSLVAADPERIELEGTASLDTYTQILRSITLDAAPVQGDRQVGLSLTDERGATSETFVINVDLSDSGSLIGEADDDSLIGQPLVDDAIVGSEGDDLLFGDSGDDLLSGGPGSDLLLGGVGDDLISGGPSADQLDGGPGADTFHYQSLADRGDVISGFDATAGDTLDFSSLFGGGADAGNIDDFVSFTPAGGNIEVSVDVDGGGPAFAAVPYLTLVDPTGVTTPDDAVNTGTVVA